MSQVLSPLWYGSSHTRPTLASISTTVCPDRSFIATIAACTVTRRLSDIMAAGD